MFERSEPLRELNSRRSKRRPRLGEGPDTECTPTDLIQPRSPRHKLQRLHAAGKENGFVLARRSRRRRDSAAGVSWDRLPDELLLRVYLWLPLVDLLRASAVCKRWHRLACDDSLWVSVDLEGSAHMGPALQQVLRTRVQRLRCPRGFVQELQICAPHPLQLLDLDLSSSVVPTPVLESILGRCRLLQNLSLEGLQLSDTVLSCLEKNSDLLQLNLSGCSGFSAPILSSALRSCCRLEQLNLSWCGLSKQHLLGAVGSLGPALTALNLSGYRDAMTLDEVKVLVERCPDIRTLDLSDSTLLTADSFSALGRLQQLQHLSLSRCYHIHLAALSDLALLPSLRLLDVFGLVQENQLAPLKKVLPHVGLNSRPFSSVARPTPSGGPLGPQPERSMWGRRCRLQVRL